AGIGHHDVDAAMELDRAPDQRLDVGLEAGIGAHERRRQPRRRLLPARLVDVGQHEPGAFRLEALGAGKPDALRCAGDDGDLVFEALHRSFPAVSFIASTASMMCGRKAPPCPRRLASWKVWCTAAVMKPAAGTLSIMCR